MAISFLCPAKVQDCCLDRTAFRYTIWLGGGPPSGVKGQIIATSHDLTPNGGVGREIPLFQENPGW